MIACGIMNRIKTGSIVPTGHIPEVIALIESYNSDVAVAIVRCSEIALVDCVVDGQVA